MMPIDIFNYSTMIFLIIILDILGCFLLLVTFASALAGVDPEGFPIHTSGKLILFMSSCAGAWLLCLGNIVFWQWILGELL